MKSISEIINHPENCTPELFEEKNGKLFLDGLFLGEVERNGWDAIAYRKGKEIARNDKNTGWSISS
jgi:hypothetical protein